jgi:hypothetical protein
VTARRSVPLIYTSGRLEVHRRGGLIGKSGAIRRRPVGDVWHGRPRLLHSRQGGLSHHWANRAVFRTTTSSGAGGRGRTFHLLWLGAVCNQAPHLGDGESNGSTAPSWPRLAPASSAWFRSTPTRAASRHRPPWTCRIRLLRRRPLRSHLRNRSRRRHHCQPRNLPRSGHPLLR